MDETRKDPRGVAALFRLELRCLCCATMTIPSNRGTIPDLFYVQEMSLSPGTSRRLVELKPEGAVLTPQV